MAHVQEALTRQIHQTLGDSYMHRFIYLIIALLCFVTGKPISIEARTPGKTENNKNTGDLLSQWRAVRHLVTDDALDNDRQREAAMVSTLGQFLADFAKGENEEFLKVLEGSVGTPQQVGQRLREALEAFDASGDSFAKKRGSFFSAYLSTLDQSGVLYSLHVPDSYDPSIPHPLEVHPRSNLKFKTPVEEKGEVSHIVVHCQGRGIEGLGDLDAIEAIRDVQKHYNIDSDRIYLAGGSIGGGAVWRTAARFPDLFAGALVDYGWTWGTQSVHLENVANIPIWIYHDTDDRWVPVAESRTAVKLLSGMNAPIIYNETSGAGHSGKLKDPAWKRQEWLLNQHRDPYPPRVTYTTATPLRGSSYWLDILEFTDPNRLATVNARVSGSLDYTQLFLDLQNIEVLEVELPTKLFPLDSPLKVVADSAPLLVPSPLPERIYVHRQTSDSTSSLYAVSLKDPRPATPFRQYAAGGPNSLYVSGEPLMIVRGTGGQDRALVDAIEHFCHSLSKGGNKGWSVFPMHESIFGRIPVKADSTITVEDEKRNNLIIVGSAETNRLLARIAPDLPAVEKDGSLHLGTDSYDLRGAGYGLFHYNPRAPQRFVWIMSSPEVKFYESINNGIADLMGEERPFGLLALRLNPRRTIRRISWKKDWSVPEGAISGELLPAPFTTDREAVRDLYHQAMCNVAGAKFVDFWKPHYYPLWEPGARWHDLAAELGQRRILYKGWASGADLQKITRSETINPEVKLGLFPPIDTLQIDSEEEYRYITGSTWAFFNLLKHPLGDPKPVQVDFFDEIHRLAKKQMKENSN
jgi:hypothetical protein